MQAPAGLSRLRTLIDLWLGWTARAGLSGGCPVAAGLFELDDAEGLVRDHLAEMEIWWRSLLSTLVTEAVDSGELRADLDRDQLVWELCGVYLSHHASSRFLHDPAADARAQRAIDALIQRASNVAIPEN